LCIEGFVKGNDTTRKGEFKAAASRALLCVFAPLREKPASRKDAKTKRERGVRRHDEVC
jgi:hypothetical protein